MKEITLKRKKEKKKKKNQQRSNVSFPVLKAALIDPTEMYGGDKGSPYISIELNGQDFGSLRVWLSP